MSTRIVYEPLPTAAEEYVTIFSPDWADKTQRKYESEFRNLFEWPDATDRPLTTESLDFATLVAYVAYLKQKPTMRKGWRGDRGAAKRVTPQSGGRRSLNSVNSSMRSVRAFVLWLFDDGRLAINPFARKNRRGGQNPLLPQEDTPTKGALCQISKR